MRKFLHNISFIISLLTFMSCSSINKTNDNSYLISSNDYHRGENQSITVEQPQNKKENKKEKKKNKNKNKNTPNTSSPSQPCSSVSTP